MRIAFTLLTLALTACPDNNQTTPEPAPEPVWQFPELVTASGDLVDFNEDPNVVEVELRAMPSVVALGDAENVLNLPMWTYNGVYPGPTLRAKVGDEIIVHFYNDLNEPTTVHWHGLRISDEMDGNPRIQDPVPAGGEFTYRFVVPEAGSFWYHPHMRTNEQLERGLAGTLVVHDPSDPEYDRERYFVLDDASLDGDRFAPFMAFRGEQVHGRTGNVLLMNGKTEVPHYTAKQGEVERWRLVNTTNARTFELVLRGAKTWVIATDGGMLGDEDSYPVRHIQLPVGQRYDVEVSYDEPGEFELIGMFPQVNENNEIEYIEIPLAIVEVEATGETPRSVALPLTELRASRVVDREVTMEFSAVDDPERGLMWQINGRSHWMDGPIFTFNEGETVKINLVNKVGPEHPFHLHGQWFEILSDGRRITQFPGLKDTVLLPGMERISILAYFDNPGRWMAHCHIAEHAELGMMGEFVVRPKAD
jgi:FtsP/CotA-like multicopper oxidase with cupredoxin domain